MRSVLLLLSLSLWALLPTRAQTAQQPKAAARIYFDQAHGEAPPPAPMAEIGQRLGYTLDLVREAATTESPKREPVGVFPRAQRNFHRLRKGGHRRARHQRRITVAGSG